MCKVPQTISLLSCTEGSHCTAFLQWEEWLSPAALATAALKKPLAENTAVWLAGRAEDAKCWPLCWAVVQHHVVKKYLQWGSKNQQHGKCAQPKSSCVGPSKPGFILAKSYVLAQLVKAWISSSALFLNSLHFKQERALYEQRNVCGCFFKSEMKHT